MKGQSGKRASQPMSPRQKGVNSRAMGCVVALLILEAEAVVQIEEPAGALRRAT